MDSDNVLGTLVELYKSHQAITKACEETGDSALAAKMKEHDATVTKHVGAVLRNVAKSRGIPVSLGASTADVAKAIAKSVVSADARSVVQKILAERPTHE